LKSLLETNPSRERVTPRLIFLSFMVAMFAFATIALVPPSVARADGWDVPKLTKLLITGDELTAALGPGLTDTVEIKPVSNADIVSVGRGYVSSDGDFININLFGSPDGSAPPKDLREFILNGGFTQDRIGGAYSDIRDYSVLGPTLTNDVLSTFSGVAAGKRYNVLAVAFIKGNVVGLVMYSSEKADPDPTIVGAAYGAELAKLP
jgi:hypothetical protein